MRNLLWKTVAMAAAVIGVALLPGNSGVWAQEPGHLTKMMVQSYDLLEAGKVAEAQKIYELVLKEDPGNPLALNNLAAIMVTKGKDKEAISHLEQALVKAKGYRVKVNKVCEVGGVCLAFRPLQEVYGNQDLEPLIRLNIQMVKGKRPAPPGK